ncbi:hypothetical protein JCM10212_006275 [Sporobolomyces blumeae]
MSTPSTAAPPRARAVPASPRVARTAAPAPTPSTSTSPAPATQASRRRKGIPHKSPARTEPYPTNRSGATGAGATCSASLINVSALLRALAREGTQNLDNQRYRPSRVPSPHDLARKGSATSTGGGGAARASQKKTARGAAGERHAHPTSAHPYGRGMRTLASQSRSTDPQRGRSAAVGLATSSTTPKPRAGPAPVFSGVSPAPAAGAAAPAPVAGSTTTTRRSVSSSPTFAPRPPASTLLSPPSRSASSTVSRPMHRSSSLGAPLDAAILNTSAVVVVGSPLARSFTSNGKGEIIEETVVEGRRSRNPSAGASAPATSPWSIKV